ncbi:MAG: hypothetical protein IT376_15665 [Polyangiaceae bacterium]|nr:hypothetical protein [Polyangiaceae bacterium]
MSVPASLSRQARLAEIGAEGLTRIAASRYSVAPAEGPLDVEREYLVRAGAVHLAPREASLPFPHAAHFRHAAPGRVAAGAWAALAQLRGALGLATMGDTGSAGAPT